MVTETLVRGVVSKVRSKQHIEDIWLADFRLEALAKQWARAIVDGDGHLAEGIKSKGMAIKKDIYAKYDVILDRF